MRRVVVLTALAALLLPAPARAADAIPLSAQPAVVDYDGVVRFEGATVPFAEVFLVQRLPSGWTVVARTHAGTDGAFAFDRRAREAGVFQARTSDGQSSGEIATQVRPRLRARVTTSILSGRILPARAGTVVLQVGGRTQRLGVGSAGRFRTRIDYLRPGQHAFRVALRPAPGYVGAVHRSALRVPALRLGSHGPVVLELKRRLVEQRYALPTVDPGYGRATHEAVMAFQKVHGLPRTGRVGGRLWRILERASRPRPRVPRGDYLEVSKTRQTLYEVRDGRVVSVIHVSTGATGNTPVGTWHVYREVFGWDWVLYHPMYFLRGFAIHGATSVPAWPASHGCVRVPLWLAGGLRERWGYGSVVRVFA